MRTRPPRPSWAPRSTLAAAATAACALSNPAAAAIGFAEAAQIALHFAPAIALQQAALAGARDAAPAAATLPDPRVSVGIDNLLISNTDRFRLNGDGMTMQRYALMQEVPNRAKREAREASAIARIEREHALLVVARLAVQREARLAWIAVQAAERRAERLAELERENRLLVDTLDARIAAGKAMPAERTMARQEALAIADRRDEATRDIARARASLRRWIGERADEPLAGEADVPVADADTLRAAVDRHAEIAPYDAMRSQAEAERREADAESRGDWSWEVVYNRRGPLYGDMVSFQLSFDLPWQRERRQQPLAKAKERELERLAAERDDTLRRHREEVEAQLAELRALDAQAERLRQAALPLAAERISLTLAGYESGRVDSGAVLAARRDAIEMRLKLIDLDAQRLALRLRLGSQVAEH